MRMYKRDIDSVIRDLERENERMKREEVKSMNQIRAAIKKNQNEEAKYMMKDIVVHRQYQIRFMKSKSQLNSLGLKLMAMNASQQMLTSFAQVTKALTAMNNRMNPMEVQKIMMRFERENGKLEMKEEMMGDLMDNQEKDTEVEESTLLAQVMTEFGFELDGQIKAKDNTLGPDGSKDELETRLESLKK